MPWRAVGNLACACASLLMLGAASAGNVCEHAGGGGGITHRYHNISGDFLLRASVSQCTRTGEQPAGTVDSQSGRNTFEVVFDAAGDGDLQHYVSWSLEPSTGTIELFRYRNGSRSVLQTLATDPKAWRANASVPLNIELLRRGTFYLLYLGGSHLVAQPLAYVERPSSDVHCQRPKYVDAQLEPLEAFTGIRDASGGVFQLDSLTVEEYRWEAAALPSKPVLSHCPTCGAGCDVANNQTAACWAYNQVIPGGGLLQLDNGSFVLYVAGQDYDGNDGGGKARMGVATGRALDRLTLHPEFLLEGTPDTPDERSIFPNGALMMANGSVVVTYMGQDNNDQWAGIFLASSPCAVGCAWRKHGVVLGCQGRGGADPMVCGGSSGKARPIHEHDLVRLPNGTYVVFYAGNTEAGDQGFMATSEDLFTWTNLQSNPALPLPLKECGQYPNSKCWDGEHRRPRSLFFYKDMWYLIYEGTSVHPSSLGACWGDTVGLSRSATLGGPYVERHPLQIIIPPQPAGTFDSTWTGWPRAHLFEATGELLVLYAAGGRDMQGATMHDYATTGLRRWSLDKLLNWTIM